MVPVAVMVMEPDIMLLLLSEEELLVSVTIMPPDMAAGALALPAPLAVVFRVSMVTEPLEKRERC